MTIVELRRRLPALSRALEGKPNVTGYGIGYRTVAGARTRELSFIVFVAEKRDVPADQAIPRDVEGVATDVVEMERLVPQANRQGCRPMPGGVEIGAASGFGTLGCYLKSEAYPDLFMLSNSHLLANFNSARAGEGIGQNGGRVATLFRFPLLWDAHQVDCAVARMDSKSADGPSPDADLALIDFFGAPQPMSQWVGAETVDVGLAYADLGGTSPDLVLLHIDAPSGANHGYLFVDRPGNTPQPIGGFFGDLTQAAGLAIADITGDGVPDAVVFFVDHASGHNQGYYCLGRDLDASGACASWDAPIPIPGTWGTQTAGGGVKAVDLSGNGLIDLVFFFIDAPGGENQGYLRIGTDCDPATGRAAFGAGTAIAVPGPWGSETQGADLAYLGPVRDGAAHRFLLVQIDNPDGENAIWYRVVDISADGSTVTLSDAANPGPHHALGWVGSQSQGIGVTARRTVRGNEIVVATVDAPAGENRVYLRRVEELKGVPHRFGARLLPPAPASLDMHVWKSGEASEVTAGYVTAMHATLESKPPSLPSYWLRETIVVEPSLTTFGDSGSVLTNDVGNVLGLLWSGAAKTSCAAAIDYVLTSLRVSSVYPVGGWIGSETAAASISAIRWMNPGVAPRTDLVVAHVDRGDAGTVGYYRVGFGVDSNGQVTGASPWTAPRPIEGWVAGRSQSVGIAVANVPGQPLPIMVVLRVDHAGATNNAWLHVGVGFDMNGDVTGGWSSAAIPNWRGGACNGVDVALADLEGTGRLDAIVLNVDDDAGENHGWYRVGRNLTDAGRALWEDWIPIPHWFGDRTAGAGIVVTNFDDNSRPEIVVFHVDEATGQNQGYYRVGWNVDKAGRSDNWSTPIPFGPWWGASTQGAGIAAAVLTDSGRPNLFALHVDNPAGENAAFYRVLYDMMPSGEPAKWSIAL